MDVTPSSISSLIPKQVSFLFAGLALLQYEQSVNTILCSWTGLFIVHERDECHSQAWTE
jgi:hypothetical protein